MAKASSKKSRPTPPRSADVGRITVKEAHALWRELFGAATKTRNLPYLRRRLAQRIRELDQEKGPSSVEREAAEVQEELTSAPAAASRKTVRKASASRKRDRDPRLPGAGAILEREYKGKRYKVTVGEEDFEYGGERFGSLSTIAKEITGQVWNGFVFFRSALLEAVGESEKKGAA